MAIRELTQHVRETAPFINVTEAETPQQKKARITAVDYFCDELEACAAQARYENITRLCDKLRTLGCDLPPRYNGAIATALLENGLF
jgi:hypothetical protein